jgi:hypothetical protein
MAGEEIEFFINHSEPGVPGIGPGSMDVPEPLLTDENGQVSYTYIRTTPGEETIEAVHPDTGLLSDPVQLIKTWEAGDPAAIVLSNEEGEFDPPAEDATNPINSSHTVYVLVEDEFGNTVADGTVIDFEVEDVDDPGTVIESGQGATTDGVASFTYDGPDEERTDNIVASFGELDSNTVTKSWEVSLPELTLDASGLDGEEQNTGTGDIVSTVSNPAEADGGVEHDPVRFRIIVDGPVACDVESWTDWFEITAIDGDSDTQGINGTFDCDTGNFVGYWGPAAGFPMPAGYDASTTFTVDVNGAPAGIYTVTVQLYNVDTDEVITEESDTFEIVTPV